MHQRPGEILHQAIVNIVGDQAAFTFLNVERAAQRLLFKSDLFFGVFALGNVGGNQDGIFDLIAASDWSKAVGIPDARFAVFGHPQRFKSLRFTGRADCIQRVRILSR